MRVYKIADIESEQKFQVGQELTYTRDSGYKGTCIVKAINPDGTLDVIDHSGRLMSKFRPVQMGMKMFEEM